jgi:hypothetical protein
MKVLKKGSTGPGVKKWQQFLHGQGFVFDKASDGKFDKETVQKTKDFQAKYKLPPDGIVGNATFGKAMQLGFEGVDFLSDPASNYPPEPNFPPLANTAARQKLFGPLEYVAAPKPGEKENIRITNGWDKENLVDVALPQLAGIKGAPKSLKVQFHRKAVKQLQDLWAAWAKAGLLQEILTWDGSYNPRFIRCSTSSLSNHAFGTAFDINAAYNPFGGQPALPGHKGCVFDLVPIANKFGFYWGGHFKTRRDGMHFEIAKLI